GLPLVAAGQVEDDGQPLTLGQVVGRAVAHEPSAGWQAPDGRPFLVELARRALALGHGDTEAELRDPRRSRIDPDSADPGLAFARAVTAVECHNSGLLATVVARHLRGSDGDAAEGQAGSAWLGPLLEDRTAQCLLVAVLGGDDGADLFRSLVSCYEQARERD